MTQQRNVDQLFELLGDRLTREILRTASHEPTSVKEMSRDLDVARSTVYRRLDSLVDHGLLRERTKAQSDGRHYAVYETVVERLTVELDEGELDCELHPSDDAPARFGKLWDGMREV